MRRVRALALCASCAFCFVQAAPQEGGFTSHRFKSRSQPSFDEVDYAELELQAKQRGLEIDEEELGPLVRRNFQHVFWRCLNQRRFLVSPPPRKVADTMLKVLSLNQRMMALLEEARRLAAQRDRYGDKEGRERRLRVVREVGSVARDLKKSFRGTFIELEKAGYQVARPSGEEHLGRYISFLLQAERIGNLITGKLDDYFFAAAPGAVAVSDYEEASIGVLSEAMEKLAKMSEKSLR